MHGTQLDSNDFDVLFSRSSLATARVSPTGRFLQVNAAYAAFFGYSEAELRELSFADVTHPDDREESARLFAALVAGEIETIQLRKRYVHRRGHTIWGQLSTAVLRDPGGRPNHMVAQVQDVTDYVQAAADLAASEERYRALVEQSPVALATVRADGVLQYANDATVRLFGASSATELVGRTVADRIPPSDRDEMLATFMAAAHSEVAPEDIDLRLLRLDGTPIDVELRSTQFRDAQTNGMLVYLCDQTERRAHELEIARLNRLSAVLSRINQAIVRLPDREQLFGDVCRTLVRTGGYRLAWIGLVAEGAEPLRPVAGWDADSGMLAPADCPPADQRVSRATSALASLPIRESGTVIGTLTVYSDEVGSFPEREQDLLREIAIDVSFSLDNLARDRLRLAAEQELRASEERLVSAQQLARLGSWEHDSATGATTFSTEMLRLHHVDPATGTDAFASLAAVTEYVHPDDRHGVAEMIEHRAEGAGPRTVEYRTHPDRGPVRHLRGTMLVTRDGPTGAVVRISGTALDVTEQRVAQETTRRALARLTEAQHVGGIGDWEYDLASGAVLWSSEIFTLLGRDPALGPPATVDENALLFEPESREFITSAVQQTLAGGGLQEGGLRAVRPDGRTVDLLARAVARRDETGAVVGLYGTLQDITALKHAEHQARWSEQRLSFALESASIGYWDRDLRTGETTRSAQHDRCFGWDEPRADWTRDTMLNQVVAEDRERVAAALNAAPHGDGGFDELFRVRWPDGSLHWLWAYGRYWFDQDHQPYRVGGIVIDVTERRRAQDATYLLAAIVESAQDAIIGVDRSGEVTSWNPAAQRLFGYSAAEMIGQPIRRLIPPDRVAEEAEMLGRAANGEFGHHYETVRQRSDGTLVEVALTISSITDADGRIVGVSGIVHDISAAKQRERALVALEEQLRQSQKMEAVGILAGGVAHDFNNLLTVILGYSDVALLRLPDDASGQQSVVEIRRAAEMAADLTRQLLAFSRQQVLRPQELDLAQVVRETSGLLQRLLGEDVALSIADGAAVAHAFADRGQVEQILMNLVANSRDAMPEYDGRLELEVTDATVAADDPVAPAGLAPGAYVRLSVTDNGRGMDDATMSQVFEPFFTTKELGSGTGLGLSTVFGIVKQSQGHIMVESRPGAGATFRIYLPAYDPTGTEDS